MTAFEINKYIGATLAALVFMMGLSVLSEIIFTEHPPEKPGYEVAIEEPAEDAGDAAAEGPSLPVLLASADVAAGKRAAAACGSCHNFVEGGPNMTGPNLWDVVGRPIAGHEGFGYSSALQNHASGGKTWSYEELDGFLHKPADWVPGTAMGFAGIAKPDARANLIAYLREISPDAPPLPTPEEAPAAEAAAPTEAPEGSDPAAGTATGTEAPSDAQASGEATPSAADTTPADANSPAAAEAAATAERGSTVRAAGQDTAQPDNPAVEGVARAAAEEIAEGGVQTGAPAQDAPGDTPATTSTQSETLGSVVTPGDVPNPAAATGETGSVADAPSPAGAPATPAAEATVPSDAAVPEGEPATVNGAAVPGGIPDAPPIPNTGMAAPAGGATSEPPAASPAPTGQSGAAPAAGQQDAAPADQQGAAPAAPADQQGAAPAAPATEQQAAAPAQPAPAPEASAPQQQSAAPSPALPQQTAAAEMPQAPEGATPAAANGNVVIRPMPRANVTIVNPTTASAAN